MLPGAIPGRLLTYNRMVVDQDDLLFGALADSTRRDIFRRAREGRLSVSALAREYPISVTAVQKHVAVLERAELVSKERVGRETIVRARERGAAARARGARSAGDANGGGGSSGSTASSTTTKETTDAGDRCEEGPRRADDDRHRGVRRGRRAGLGDVVGPAAAGALVGPAVPSGDLRRPRLQAGRPRRLLHDRARTGRSTTAGGASRRSSRPAACASKTASPTTRASRTRRCRRRSRR